MIYFKQNGTPVQLGEELAHGGEGTIYDVSETTVAKVFFEPQSRFEKIQRFVTKHINHQHICTPSELLYDSNNEFVGYLMLKATGFDLAKSIFQPQLFKQKFPNWTRIELTQFVINLLETVSYLHDNDILIGDINPNNIIVNDFDDFYLLDTDSFQIDTFPCPVGTVAFTAPEIQNKEFGTFLRTKEHEYFSLATLLFEIYVPGKHPYSRTGGASLQENILKHDFVFPLGDNDENATPKGQWEAIWYNLPFEVRKFFYEIFKENHRHSTHEWLPVLRQYLDELNSNLYSRLIFPYGNTESLAGNKTLNMNRRDITDKDDELRKIETILRPTAKPEKIAVLELSTKAVKLLIGNDQNEILNNLHNSRFDFRAFLREASKTDTGRGLDRNNMMDMDYFRNRVLPSIITYRRMAVEHGVDRLYTVATAAYRTANNRDEILACIRNEANVNVRILKKEEEALATIFAFFFSTKNKEELRNSEYQMIIDQGGGSTEVSLFKGSDTCLKSYSMNLGTEVLRTILFKESNEETTLRQALANADKLIRDRLDTLYKNISDGFPINGKIACIAVGTAITKATGKKGNPKQHDTVLTMSNLIDTVKRIDEDLKGKFVYSRELYNAVNNNLYYYKNRDELDGQIVMRVGLPMFIAIMKRLGISQLTVSGTGLWYGIYFQQLLNPNQI
jgi:serine/threonine protein kinase